MVAARLFIMVVTCEAVAVDVGAAMLRNKHGDFTLVRVAFSFRQAAMFKCSGVAEFIGAKNVGSV